MNLGRQKFSKSEKLSLQWNRWSWRKHLGQVAPSQGGKTKQNKTKPYVIGEHTNYQQISVTLTLLLCTLNNDEWRERWFILLSFLIKNLFGGNT
jgi:hypothetical protein